MNFAFMDQASFHISTDKKKLDINLIFDFLNREAYWSKEQITSNQ